MSHDLIWAVERARRQSDGLRPKWFDANALDASAATRGIDINEVINFLAETGQMHTIIYLSGSAIRITRAGHVSLVEAKR